MKEIMKKNTGAIKPRALFKFDAFIVCHPRACDCKQTTHNDL